MTIMLRIWSLLLLLMSVFFISCEQDYDCTVTLYRVDDSHTPGISRCTKEDMTERTVFFLFGIDNHTNDYISSDFIIEAHYCSRRTILNGLPFDVPIAVKPGITKYKNVTMKKNNFEELGLDIYNTQPELLAKSLTFTLSDSTCSDGINRPISSTFQKNNLVLVLQNTNFSDNGCESCVKKPINSTTTPAAH